tara:strand:+ start:36 stop:377 length:342 start_codon:yes stop_codon:yes gene_type:complete
MNYSDELVQRLDRLGIDMSTSPDNTRRQLEDYYDTTKDHVFGYIEDLTEFNQVFEPVYGVEYFILVKEVYGKFMEEYNRYLDCEQLKEALNEIRETSRMARQLKERYANTNTV